MVLVEKYDCTVLLSDRPDGALTCQSEREGREFYKDRERRRVTEMKKKKKKRKDMSVLRNTHLLMSCPESPGRNTLLPHSPVAPLVCVCFKERKHVRVFVRVCVCVLAPCWSVLNCTEAYFLTSPQASVNLCCV